MKAASKQHIPLNIRAPERLYRALFASRFGPLCLLLGPSLVVGSWSVMLFFWLGAGGDASFGQEAPGPGYDPVIHYGSTDGLADPVTLLRQRLADRSVRLEYEPKRGFLTSLLKELRVPVTSQALVFSKTSSQRDQTSPHTPRAIYFSDDVAVGWVPGGQFIDIASVDPSRGPIFYTLSQSADTSPRFARGTDCMQCHLGSKTLNVPGLLVRSFYTASDGTPLGKVDGFLSGHNSSLRDRWGGWYVTGTHAREFHLGNIFATNFDSPQQLDISAGANLADLRERFDTRAYLSPASDIVALLVLEHQVRMQNLITLAHYETRYALDEQAGPAVADKDNPVTDLTGLAQERVARAGERLLEYMLFRDEAPVKGPIKGTTAFAEEFQLLGPRDSKGRSLRELELTHRLFRYPCSFLIYSPSFDTLPQEMKTYLWQRLEQILTGKDNGRTYSDMAIQDRQDVMEILRNTKQEFAQWVRTHEVVSGPRL